MICTAPSKISQATQTRRGLARERARLAREMLADCRFCAHDCGVNRLAGETGRCHAGAEARFFQAQTEVTDELELIPTFAVALSGCDLRCDFCITGAESWNPRAGKNFSADEMAAKAMTALEDGAKTVMILGGEPTIHLPAALELVAALPDDAKLIWKTNAHGSARARELLEGMFDVWLADYKFGNDVCAQRLAKVPDYTGVVRENLLWFAGQSDAERRAPSRPVGSQGASKRAETVLGAPVPSELIVRHLLMPGHLDCCWQPVAEWLAENLPGVKVNLRSGFWPAWKSARHAELNDTIADPEARRAEAIAQEYRLNLVY
ncbi:MAG TPA: radical SAM protein [Verrucomicrobiae bacterium]|nr:radical SAM protein [Verrucomicrobiae bacterium]